MARAVDLGRACANGVSAFQAAVLVFNDTTKSDADVLAAFHNAGAQCNAIAAAIPQFVGEIGQYYRGRVVEGLTDGGGCGGLGNATNVGPGQFSLTAAGNLVGDNFPIWMNNLHENYILVNQPSIDAQEAGTVSPSGASYSTAPSSGYTSGATKVRT